MQSFLNHGTYWSAGELNYMRSLRDKFNFSWETIANELGRSVPAVKARYNMFVMVNMAQTGSPSDTLRTFKKQLNQINRENYVSAK